MSASATAPQASPTDSVDPAARATLSLAPGYGTPISDVASFDAYLAATARAGFDAVSLDQQQLSPVIADGAEGLTRARSRLTDLGLHCTDVMSLGLRGQARNEIAEASTLIDAGARLGAASVLIVCFTKPTDEVLTRLDHLAQLAADRGLRLALEFAPGLAIHSISTGLEIVEQLGADRVRLAIDTWHFFRGGSSWADLEQVPLDSIELVQFDDAQPLLSEDVMIETRNRRAWPGLGEFELQRFAQTLTARGWHGIVSVEVLSEETRLLDLATFTERAYETTAPYWVPR